jgi:phosphoglycolate phosphatase
VGPRVLLFDLDGTLVSTGGAGRRAMIAAMVEVFDAPAAFEGFDFAGMTDRSIVRAGITKARGAATDADIDRVLDAYLPRLEAELESTAHYRVFPGVSEIVRSVTRAGTGVAVGLGTGNVKRGAYAKLARSALGDAFPFGGFGCDAEDRTELIRTGATRGAEALGETLASCRVIVIGDTPRDVTAAHGIGAACLAVATGPYTRAQLQEAGADWAVDTLEGPEMSQILLGS